MSKPTKLLSAAALALLTACDSTPPPLVRADPAITVSPEMIDFGEVKIGLTKLDEVVVTNPGRGDLVIDIARVEGEGKAAFTLSAPDIMSIPAGRNKLATITFAPMTPGRFNASLVLYHNIPGKDAVQVPLTGLSGTTPGCVDRDMDGFGEGCPMPDCNDNNGMIHPGATELCNGVDDNCNRLIDDGVLIQMYYRDADGDGYAPDGAAPMPACAAPPGHVTRLGDCDDTNNLIHPGAKEPCDGVDNDCDGIRDNGVALTEFWPDMDGDMFGSDTSTAVRACAAPPRHVAVRGDCDDSNAAIKPGAAEVCNGLDDNCNRMIDEGLPLNDYYPDLDMDTYGSVTASVTRACMQPPRTATRRMDCDDTNPNVRPNAMEICSGGVDEDCDRLIDGSDPDCAPAMCTAQDQCGLTSNRMACPFLGAGPQLCARVCDNTGECMGNGSCRPLPGATQFGFCTAQTGTVAHGMPCRSSASCSDGICILGKCSKLCQTQADCTGGEECGVGLWNTSEAGGANQLRLTSTCRPVEGGRQPIGGSCKVDAQNADSSLCNTGHCDFLPFGYQLSTQAPCAPLCAGSGDCGPQQVCGLIYHGLAENPPIPGTGEGAGRYFEGIFGCYTPVIDLGLGPQPVPPGSGAIGASCTTQNARTACRSHQCAQFLSPQRCTDFCDEDADCRTPSTSNWRCAFGELSLTGVYLQALQVADITKFTLVGVCAPP